MSKPTNPGPKHTETLTYLTPSLYGNLDMWPGDTFQNAFGERWTMNRDGTIVRLEDVRKVA